MNTWNKYRILVYFSMICFVYCLFQHILFAASVTTCIQFLFAQIIALFIPGYALSCIFLRTTSVIERTAVSYALGYALILIEYMIIYSLQLQHFTTIIVILIAVVSLAWFCRCQNSELEESASCKSDLGLISIWLLYLGLSVIAYAGVNSVNDSGVTLGRDVAFWASNASALRLDFPPSAAYMRGGLLVLSLFFQYGNRFFEPSFRNAGF